MACDSRTILTLCLLAATVGIPARASTDRVPPVEGIQQGLTALSEGDPRLAEQVALAVARGTEDGTWRAWLIVATARERLGRLDEAVEAYREFMSMCADPVERAFAADRIRRCRRRSRRTGPDKPASERLSPAALARLAKVEERTYTESSEHFVVRARNAELARVVARQSEAALQRICGTLLAGQEYPHTVDVYVWPDIAEYRRHATSATEWAGGSFRLARDDDGFMVRRIDLTQCDDRRRFDPVTLDRVLPHEMCHLVLAELFGGAHCPLAVNEGLAMMAEATVHNGRIRLAGAALATRTGIDLPALLRLDRCHEGNVDVFYAESYSLMTFMHSRLTGAQFRDTLTHLKAGLPLDEALQRALYVPPDEEFLTRLERSWRLEAVRQSQFLQALDVASGQPS